MTSNDPKRDLLLPGCRIRLPFWTALLTLLQVGAAVYALQIPPELSAEVGLPAAFQFVIGALWAFLFAVITVLLIQGRRHARRYAVWAVLVFASYTVARWIFFTRADYDRQRLPVLIFGTFCVLIILVASYYDLKREQPQDTEKTADDSEP